MPGTTNDSGAVRTYSFAVPASVQAAGSEAPIAFTIDAVDDAGTATLPDAVGVGQLLIDDAPPQPGGVTVTGGVTGTDGLQWFKQTATGSIDAQVSVEDHGSGVNASTLRLMAGAVRLDNGAPQCAASGTSPAVLCHFFISPQTALVPAGGQAEVTFTVAGQDVAGNDMAVQQAKVGIDGKAPVITFVPAYPAAGADCNAGGGDPDNLFCGHDGSHFFRAGDSGHNLAFAVNDASGDVGSGANPASGTCAIQGTTCTATFNAGGRDVHLPGRFLGGDLCIRRRRHRRRAGDGQCDGSGRQRSGACAGPGPRHAGQVDADDGGEGGHLQGQPHRDDSAGTAGDLCGSERDNVTRSVRLLPSRVMEPCAGGRDTTTSQRFRITSLTVQRPSACTCSATMRRSLFGYTVGVTGVATLVQLLFR